MDVCLSCSYICTESRAQRREHGPTRNHLRRPRQHDPVRARALQLQPRYSMSAHALTSNTANLQRPLLPLIYSCCCCCCLLVVATACKWLHVQAFRVIQGWASKPLQKTCVTVSPLVGIEWYSVYCLDNASCNYHLLSINNQNRRKYILIYLIYQSLSLQIAMSAHLPRPASTLTSSPYQIPSVATRQVNGLFRLLTATGPMYLISILCCT